MNRIDQRFAELKERGETAMIPFLTIGDPWKHPLSLFSRWNAQVLT